MKVYNLRPECPQAFLGIKSIHFNPESREACRQHVKKETESEFVWFEDEEPPNEVVEAIVEQQRRLKGDFGDENLEAGDQES